MNESDIIRLLRQRYCRDKGNGPEAVLLPQVRSRAGFDARRTADALVMQLWPSRGLHLEGFEIKVSRSDWLRELRDPTKADEFARWCDKWWIVAPDGMVKTSELPDTWGLMAVKTGVVQETILGPVEEPPAKLVTVRAAAVRDVPASIPKTLLASMLRQFDRTAAR